MVQLFIDGGGFMWPILFIFIIGFVFVGERLADFKVPRKIVFLDEIPKGQTGKLQRIGLAEKLGLVR